MADNPFTGLILGLQGGFAAGRNRRMLLEQAEGDPNVRVPGLAENFLQGFQLAQTLPQTASEETQRQSVEAQMALGMLNARNREQQIKNQFANDILTQERLLRDQEQDLEDAQILANEASRLQSLIGSRRIKEADAAIPPLNLSSRGMDRWWAQRDAIMDSWSTQQHIKRNELIERLDRPGFDAANKTISELRREEQRVLSMEAVDTLQETLKQEGVTSASVSVPGGQIHGRVKGDAVAEAEGMSTSQIQSTILRIQQDIVDPRTEDEQKAVLRAQAEGLEDILRSRGVPVRDVFKEATVQEGGVIDFDAFQEWEASR